ncbi:MAG: AMP-binding protein, partial [Bacteroidota bacterium]
IPNDVTPDLLAAIVYTSGTTGHSKGVMLTHNNIVSDVIGTTHIVDLQASDRLLSILPLAHTYECTLGLTTALAVGATIYYLDKLPTANALLPAMKEVKPTVMLSVPLVIEKIFKMRIHPQLNSSFIKRRIQKIQFLRKRINRIAGKKLLTSFGGNLRLFCIGGAPLAPDVEQFLREANFPYAMGYGLTETAPLIAGTNSALTKYRATGKSLPETEIRIAEPDPENGEGEIIVKGPTVMRGYYKDEERTQAAFTADGWFKTGDLGVIDPDGYIYIKGRSKNMILGSNGKNIYPEEIESIINEFDLVLESLVYEKDHQITARIYLDYDKVEEMLKDDESSESKTREGIKELLKDLKQQINDRLSSYSRIMEIFEQTEPFEKTPTQKIKRHLYA